MASCQGWCQWDEAAMDHRNQVSPALLDIVQQIRPAAQHPAAPCRIKGSGLSLQVGKPGWMDAPLYYDVQAVIYAGSGSFTPSLRGEVLEGYHSLRAGLGYSRKLAEWMDAGLRFSYHRTMAAGHRPGSGIMLDAGMIWDLGKQLVADLCVFNIALLQHDFPFSYRPPPAIRSGLGYRVSGLAGFGLGLLTVPGRPPALQVHLAYRVHDRINAKLSYCTGANRFSLALGFLGGHLQYSINFAYMFPLGMEAGLEGQYRWGGYDPMDGMKQVLNMDGER